MSRLRIVDAVLETAGRAGATATEVFVKTASGRQIALEPPSMHQSGRRIAVSDSGERGVAVRVLNREQRWGFAWRAPIDLRAVASIVEEAMVSASRSSPLREAVDPGMAPPAGSDLRSGPESQAPDAPDGGSPRGLFDPRVATTPTEILVSILEEASESASFAAEGNATVDRIVLSVASTHILLANSLGYYGEYRRTPVLLSVAMAPHWPGIGAILEERSACSLAGLDPRECGMEAGRRCLPARAAAPPPPRETPLILGPRATASFVSALVPWLLAKREWGVGSHDARRRAPVAGYRGGLTIVDDGRLPATIGSAPFDGVGRAMKRVMLAAGGMLLGMPTAADGNIVRQSLREPPAVGLTNLVVEHERTGPLEESGEVQMHASLVRLSAGRLCALRILRGDLWSGGGPIDATDGLIWEGPIERVLAGVTATGTEMRFFHLGLPIGAPSIRIDGLGPWMVESRTKRPYARLAIGGRELGSGEDGSDSPGKTTEGRKANRAGGSQRS